MDLEDPRILPCLINILVDDVSLIELPILIIISPYRRNGSYPVVCPWIGIGRTDGSRSFIQCTPGTNVDVNIIDGLTTRVWTFVLARRRSITLDVCRNLWIHWMVFDIALNNMTKDALTHASNRFIYSLVAVLFTMLCHNCLFIILA